MEAVITRAIELQARIEERTADADEGIGAAELVRIAQELGISPQHVQQAIAEVRGKPPAENDLLTSFFGQRHVGVSRYVPLPAAKAREQIDRYLIEKEAMVVLRRHTDRTIYERGAGVGAAVARAASTVGARHPLLKAKTITVSVAPVDEKSCFVAVSIDLSELRSGTAIGTAVAGVSGGGVAVGIALILAPPVALAVVPVLGGFAYLMRVTYRNAILKRQNQLESLLDRLEHRELIDSGPAGLLKRFGF
jgi:hypothetical protein